MEGLQLLLDGFEVLLGDGELVGLVLGDVVAAILLGDAHGVGLVGVENPVAVVLALDGVGVHLADRNPLVRDERLHLRHHAALVRERAGLDLVHHHQQRALHEVVVVLVQLLHAARGGVGAAEDGSQDVVAHHALAGTFGAVQYPRGAGAVAFLEDERQPVDEVVVDVLVAADGVEDHTMDCLGYGGDALGHRLHVGAQGERVDHLGGEVHAHGVMRVEDQIPFRDEVAQWHAVLFGEVAQLGFILGDVQVQGVVGLVVSAAPVGAGLAVTERKVGQAVARHTDRFGGDVAPVIRQQLFGQVAGLALEVVDELGVVLRVVVGPGVTAVQVEVGEAALGLHVRDRAAIWLHHDLGRAVHAALELARWQPFLGTQFGDPRVRQRAVLLAAEGSADRQGCELALDVRDPRRAGHGVLHAPEYRRCDVDQLVVLACGDVQRPADRVVGLGEGHGATQQRGDMVQVNQPLLEQRCCHRLVQDEEQVGSDALVRDAHGC